MNWNRVLLSKNLIRKNELFQIRKFSSYQPISHQTTFKPSIKFDIRVKNQLVQNQNRNALIISNQLRYGVTSNKFSFNSSNFKQKPKKPLWKRIALFILYSVGFICTASYICITRANANVTEEDGIIDFGKNGIEMLKKLPLKSMSRLWASFFGAQLPVFLRAPVYKMYAWFYDGNLEECEYDLKEYKSLQEFFGRRLKDGVRVWDEEGEICSPVDGKVMAIGKCYWTKSEPLFKTNRNSNSDKKNLEETIAIEQVKGLDYRVDELIHGEVDDELMMTKNRSDSNPAGSHGKTFYYCILYLAPGDYHRYHCPVDFKVSERKHISGYLFPVMPTLVRMVRGLFAVNERVVLSGKWNHGDFHYVVVGATNVGSMILTGDVAKDFHPTNTKEQEKEWKKKGFNHVVEKYKFPNPSMKDSKENEGIFVSKSDEIGKFQMGSSIVMVFEHENDSLEFNIKKGQRIKLGQKIV